MYIVNIDQNRGLSVAASDVITERLRQVEAEGWTAEHDDEHADGSLALAAVCFATPVKLYREDRFAAGPAFVDPWPKSWAKRWDNRYRYGERKKNPGSSVPDPATYTAAERRDLLVKAGAFIIAEIERLDRAETHCCIACAVAFKPGDKVLDDASGGLIHASCCGPERESYVNADGDPLGPDDPIPEGWEWQPYGRGGRK